jgi:hypothetical protein
LQQLYQTSYERAVGLVHEAALLIRDLRVAADAVRRFIGVINRLSEAKAMLSPAARR